MHPIHARPERTEEAIQQDEEAAEMFWKNLPRYNPQLRRLIERESCHYTLLLADREGREWAGRLHDTASDRRGRRAARLAADPLAHRRNEKLRPYADPDSRSELPATALQILDKEERVASLNLSSAWFRSLFHLSAQRRRRILKDQNRQFARWLLVNPHYGPANSGGDAPSRQFEPWRYVAGEIRPAGMTPERALQIAIDVLHAHGGHW